MNLNEAAALLNFTRAEVRIAIQDGIELPISKEIIRIEAHLISGEYDIDDISLDSFICRFDKEEPGRHPPVAVRRELLIEAHYGCAICSVPLYEFHHIIEFSKIGHYDARHMLALCPNHHSMCTKGNIDLQAQYEIKKNLASQIRTEDGSQFLYSIGPANFSWVDLRQIIVSLHESVVVNNSTGTSRFDFTEIDIRRKNEINHLGEEYYQTVIASHEPYFRRIYDFLRNPINVGIANLYYQVVDEMRTKLATSRDEHERFELFLTTFADVAVKGLSDGRSQDRRTLNIIMSFMYVNCDIGRKE